MHKNRSSSSAVPHQPTLNMDDVADHPSRTDVLGCDFCTTIPKFTEHPSLWFRHLEVYFHLNKITSQTSKYHRVLPALPRHVRLAVLELIEEIPQYRPYDVLKNAIITRMNEIYETRARRLLPDVELGNKLPSEMLAYMRRAVRGSQIGDMELRLVWTKCMPEEIRPKIECCPYDTPLTKLADFADDWFKKWQEGKNRTSESIEEEAKLPINLTMGRLEMLLDWIFARLDRLQQ
ncbi:unnamed protein product [Mesocestoides corti]|uniref:DUF7041 domain-containing protein n=2 Tax=Mesocestoides corti TaxID=53468 RepID=A0A0R3UAE4_MESCO|nr:unnamed protein product [Mesocestoides corti]